MSRVCLTNSYLCLEATAGRIQSHCKYVHEIFLDIFNIGLTLFWCTCLILLSNVKSCWHLLLHSWAACGVWQNIQIRNANGLFISSNFCRLIFCLVLQMFWPPPEPWERCSEWWHAPFRFGKDLLLTKFYNNFYYNCLWSQDRQKRLSFWGRLVVLGWCCSVCSWV